MPEKHCNYFWRVLKPKNEFLVTFFTYFLSNPVNKMNFFRGASGSMRLMSQNTLQKIDLKKQGGFCWVLVSKLVFGQFLSKKAKILKFFENFDIFVILAYKIHNRILILEKSGDFYFWLFSRFWKSFGSFQMTSIPGKVKYLFLSYVT